MTVCDAPTESGRDELIQALESRLLPQSIADSQASLCIGLTPTPLPEDAPSYAPRPMDLSRRVLLLSFFSGEPGAALREWAETLSAAIEAEGLGELRLAASFIPTIAGTDRYADELW